MWQRLALKRLTARPFRTAATILGVAALAALCSGALHLHRAGVDLQASKPGEPLVVMQVGRVCPSTSKLPWDLQTPIAQHDGVEAVLAQQVVVSDCKISTTATTFRGVDPHVFAQIYAPKLAIQSGSLNDWGTKPLAALVGSQVAQARDLSVGDSFQSAGLEIEVAAIVSGERMQDRASIWVDRAVIEDRYAALVQQATLFEVYPEAGTQAAVIAQGIDAQTQHTTHTAPFSATAARVAGSLAEVLQLGGILALTGAIAGFVLLFNAALLGVRRSAADFAVLRAIGHGVKNLAAIVSLEGLVVGVLGGLLGGMTAAVILSQLATTISTEGISVVIDVSPNLIALVVLFATLAGVVASALPAWWVARGSLRQHLAMGAG